MVCTINHEVIAMKEMYLLIGSQEIGCEEITGFGDSIGVGGGISGVGEGIRDEYEGI
jgi:hypothetical protein